MEQIAQLLSQSLQLGPVRRQAELGLQQNENVPGFLLILLQLVGNESIPNEIRLAGSILFKNQIRKNWSQVSFLSLLIVIYILHTYYFIP